MQNCKRNGYQDYTLKDPATVMSEAMKTLMETPNFDYGSKTSMYLMYEAVQTPPAQEAWKHGKCNAPGALAVDRAPDETILIHIP